MRYSVHFCICLFWALCTCVTANAFEAARDGVSAKAVVVQNGIEVSGTSFGKAFGWRLDGYSFSEEQKNPVVIIGGGSKTYVLVAAFTGGAHCCWGVEVFSLDGGVTGREVALSRNTIDFFGALSTSVFFDVVPISTEFDEWNAPTVRYVFSVDGLRVDTGKEAIKSYANQLMSAKELLDKNEWECKDVMPQVRFFEREIVPLRSPVVDVVNSIKAKCQG